MNESFFKGLINNFKSSFKIKFYYAIESPSLFNLH